MFFVIGDADEHLHSYSINGLTKVDSLTMCKAIRILHDALQVLVNKGVASALRAATGSAALVLALSGVAAVAGDTGAFQPIGYVTDAAQVVDAETERKIADLSEELERKTGIRVCVVTLQTIEGAEIETFATDLLKNWKPDPQERGRTILLVDALAEEKFRLELGTVVDTLLSEQCARRLQEQVLLPSLRSGNKGLAYLLTVTELADEIAKQRGVTLYRLKGPGYLRSLPAAASMPGDSPAKNSLSLWFLPALMATLWIGYRETRAAARRRPH